ncbi:MAG: hypothetical protein GEU28_07025 [Dehalococcoidia bacterium]|nr:hypothetical protein [Dehalococcoidia bacterium]
MPLREFIEKKAEMAKDRLEPLRERIFKSEPDKPDPHYAMPGTSGDAVYRIYRTDIVASVVIDGLDLPVAAEVGEIGLAKEYGGRIYKYSGKGTRIKGHSASLPDMVWPYLEADREVLLVEYGDSYVVFVTD